MEMYRIKELFTSQRDGDYVLYWMETSQRVHWNHGLAFAIQRANTLKKPLLVYFGMDSKSPDLYERQWAFMLEGLKDVTCELKQLGVGFEMNLTDLEQGLFQCLQRASELVMDKGYLKGQKAIRENVLMKIQSTCPMSVYEVESNVVVPVEVTSQKEEYGARTIRKKIWDHARNYLMEPSIQKLVVPFEKVPTSNACEAFDVEGILARVDADRRVKRVFGAVGGEQEALKMLNDFIGKKLKHYLLKNHPELDYISNMSPYLHFGHIAPAYILIRIQDHLEDHPEDREAAESFIEELVVRRELAFNFVHFNPGYDQFAHMTYTWAYETMGNHIHDQRDYSYTLEVFEAAKTHDPYWNACMLEMIHTGRMHTYMRMYWCKKIIEWAPDYQRAYNWALYLNNKYFLDGCDPNSYTGVAWCFGKHDRAWKERPVFGKLRYMNSNGLKRKFEIDEYVEKVKALIEKASYGNS